MPEVPTRRGGVAHYPRRVVRRLPLRAIAGVATALLLACGGTGPATAAPAGPANGDDPPGQSTPRAEPDDDYDAPLEITINGLTPGFVPRQGPVVISGTVTNVDLEEWRLVKVYPFTNAGPDCVGCPPIMTTAAEIELAAKSDPKAPAGDRLLNVAYDVPALGPGESASFTLRIPQPLLRRTFNQSTAGVYWFGVHALGQSDSSARDDVADGRARTFLPVVPPAAAQTVDTSIVVPLRAPITYGSDGELNQTSRWQEALAPDGDLGGPLSFGAASGAEPVTWLLDPALPDALRQLALGNAPRDFTVVRQEPGEEPTGETEGGDGEGDEGDGDEGDEGDGGDGGDGGDDGATDDGTAVDPDDPLAKAADTWLRQARTVLTDDSTDSLALLPYGDPDVAAVGADLPDLYDIARAQTSAVLSAWEVAGTPTVAGPNGYLDEAGIDGVSDGATVLLGDQMFPVETFSERPPVGGLVGERPVVVTSSGAAGGGPGPDPATAPIALRQRILAEAVVRMLRADATGPEPLVVVLPSDLDADGARAFWEGLDVGWLRLTGIESQTASASGTYRGKTSAQRQIDPAELTYPNGQERAEVPGMVLRDAQHVIRLARSLQDVLGEQVRIASTLVGEALTATSYSLRNDDGVAERLTQLREWTEDRLGEITLEAPPGATLSGTSGSFNVSVRNTLDYPVTVQIEAATDRGAAIKAANPIVLAANSRVSIPISADMSQPGVHNVRLQLTDSTGVPIGASDELPIRSGQAGVVIWAIIGAGAGILFIAIGIRLYRRFRRSGDPDGADGADGAAAVAAAGPDEPAGDQP